MKQKNKMTKTASKYLDLTIWTYFGQRFSHNCYLIRDTAIYLAPSSLRSQITVVTMRFAHSGLGMSYCCWAVQIYQGWRMGERVWQQPDRWIDTASPWMCSSGSKGANWSGPNIWLECLLGISRSAVLDIFSEIYRDFGKDQGHAGEIMPQCKRTSESLGISA